MIGKLMKEARNGYAVVKYDDGFFIVSKSIPDFAIKSDYTFGNYKGVQVTKPLITTLETKAKLPQGLLDAKAKLPQKILNAFESTSKQEQERYKELEKLKAPKLQKISKELEREISKYGLNRFIHQYQGHDKALLAGAIEIAFKEKVNLKGDIVVGIIKFTYPQNFVEEIIKNTTIKQKVKQEEIQDIKQQVKYLPLVQSKANLKKLQEKVKELEEGKTDEAKEALKVVRKYYKGQIPFGAKIEPVNANKVKENIKRDMSENQAWLALLTAWCDVRGRMSPVNVSVPSIVYRAKRKVELKEPKKIEENGILTGEVVNIVKNSRPTIYGCSALFDVLARMYAQGELDKTKGSFAVIKGKMSKGQLEELKKQGLTIIDTNTIYRLLGNKNVVFARNVKNVLWSFDELRYDLFGLNGNDQVIQRYRFVYPWRPSKGVPDEIEFLNHLKGWRGFEIREDLFKIYKQENTVTYALVDNASFYKISEAGKRLGVGPRRISDTKDVWLYLFKTAGSKPTGQRIAYVSYQAKGIFELTNRHPSKRNEIKERIKGSLDLLGEAGLINDFFPSKSKREFMVDIGG